MSERQEQDDRAAGGPSEPPAERPPTVGQRLRLSLYDRDRRQNRAATKAYVLGLSSALPCIGIPVGIAAIAYGVIGLRKAAVHPEAGGRGEALVGIIVGSLFAVAYLLLAVMLILSEVIRVL